MCSLFQIITKRLATTNLLGIKVTHHKWRLTWSNETLEENIFTMTTVLWDWIWAWAPISIHATLNIIHAYFVVWLDAPIIAGTPARVSMRVSHYMTNSVSRVVSETVITNCPSFVDQQAQSVRTGPLTVRLHQTKVYKINFRHWLYCIFGFRSKLFHLRQRSAPKVPTQFL